MKSILENLIKQASQNKAKKIINTEEVIEKIRHSEFFKKFIDVNNTSKEE